MNPSYRRISESDDEFIHFVLPTLGDSSQSSCIRRPMHTSKLTGGCRVHEILTGHERLCKRNFRMEVDIFHALVNKLREKEYLTVAKNATNETLQDWFQHSPDTIHRYFKAVQEAITNLTSVYIRAPSLHPHPILRKPQFYPFFQNCIGAIDGTHIPMKLPLDEQESYRNRKQTISQNCMNCIGAIDGTHIPMKLPLDEQESYRNRKQTISQNCMVACDFDLNCDPIRGDPNAKVYARKQQGASDLRITTQEEAPNLQSTRPCRSLPWLFSLLPLRPVTWAAKVHPVPAIDVGEEVQYPIMEPGEEVVEEMGSKAMASMRVCLPPVIRSGWPL
ncbi:hypothetical protein OsJ_11771 [Oryza sativa Japonica Group]|uniref:DUF8040 domain-containing protein n=1 Tax=Oryza sativa subsp. japonica TaxID=39947 RepID=B9F9R9_ORYSJ|nr:hypothetical protein OsJ_11771 [Oryza sativa Japonica Group]